MPPLILHNVPDDELYVGEDGVTRPYAMLFPGNEGPVPRSRRAVPETGSFGKSTRRSRSRTGTPAAAKKEDPTLAAADAIFSNFLQNNRAATPSEPPQRKSSLSASISQPHIHQGGPLTQSDGNGGGPSSRYVHKEPTEVMLRGFKSSEQYAAIREYERIGGRICEDYPRDAPLEQRRYKADLRDPASLRRKRMTPEEKAKALKFAGGDTWIKVTFESHEAAETAIDASPQVIHGHMVYAEMYRGIPPSSDKEIPANSFRPTAQGIFGTASMGPAAGQHAPPSSRRQASTLPRSYTTSAISDPKRGGQSLSPPTSHTSSSTLDTNTLSNTSGTLSSATVTGFTSQQSNNQQTSQSQFCTRIPTAKKIQLLPAEQALLPQQSYGQRIVKSLPIIGWFTNDIIGSSVPRTETGEFDWKAASMYWKLMWWIDSWTGWLEIANNEKEE